MLRNFDILTSDPIPVTELYFKQCSISVTRRDLAVMAATLANRGVNPLTGKQAIRGEYVESVLSVMETCGMYNFAGQWMYEVGMPAKSGVAGGVIAVLRVNSHRSFRRDSMPMANNVRGIRVATNSSPHLDLPSAEPADHRPIYHPGQIPWWRHLVPVAAPAPTRTCDSPQSRRENPGMAVAGQLAFSTTESSSVILREIQRASTDYFIPI